MMTDFRRKDNYSDRVIKRIQTIKNNHEDIRSSVPWVDRMTATVH